MEALLPPYVASLKVPPHPSIFLIPPRARFDCTGGTWFIFGLVQTHPLPG